MLVIVSRHQSSLNCVVSLSMLQLTTLVCKAQLPSTPFLCSNFLHLSDFIKCHSVPVTVGRLSSRRCSAKAWGWWALSSWETWGWEATNPGGGAVSSCQKFFVRVEIKSSLTSSTKSRSSRETSKSWGWCANTSSRALSIISQNWVVPSIIIDIPLVQQVHLVQQAVKYQYQQQELN
jgi:hypothetical protein